MSHQQVEGRPIFDGAPILTRDNIVIRVRNIGNATTLRVGGRVLNNDATLIDLNQSLVIAQSTLIQDFTIPVLDGQLSSLQISALGSQPVQGQVFVEVFMAFGSGTNLQRYRSIMSGYPSPQWALSWPSTNSNQPGTGPGRFRTLGTANPGAGNEIFTLIDDDRMTEIESYFFVLNTSGVAGNRSVNLIVADGNPDQYMQIRAGVLQPANTSWFYTFTRGVPYAADAADNFVLAPFPSIRMAGTNEITTMTTGLLAGDTFTDIRAMVREWAQVDNG